MLLASASPNAFTPVLRELGGNLAAEAADLRKRVDAARPYCAFADLKASIERDGADADVAGLIEDDNDFLTLDDTLKEVDNITLPPKAATPRVQGTVRQAERRVRLGLILAEVVKANGLQEIGRAHV